MAAVARSDAPADDGPAMKIIEPVCAVFRRTLKAEGLKYTPERARILDEAVRFSEPFRAEALLDRLRAGGGQRISKATVYRTIRLLQQAGILQQVLLDADQTHYLLAWGHGDDGLLVRTDTHSVERLDLPELAALRDRLCRQRGLEAQ
ncbi:MAG: transcriptional repressor, partial [Phycisphaerae bacterium]|nr:transcriptional repressor [Phycisphaerae bacterium]